MKLIVTGGAGFIGSAVIRLALAKGINVLNLDSLTYAANLDNLIGHDQTERYRFEKIDVRDRSALDSVISDYAPDAIMHLAAESHVDRSIDGPAEFIETNILGTYNLIEAARHYWQTQEPEKKAQFRFHHISTDEVYGDVPHPSEADRSEERRVGTE